jgi:hypothetical protein
VAGSARQRRRQETAAPPYQADAAPYHTWVPLLAWLRTHGIDSVTRSTPYEDSLLSACPPDPITP